MSSDELQWWQRGVIYQIYLAPLRMQAATVLATSEEYLAGWVI